MMRRFGIIIMGIMLTPVMLSAQISLDEYRNAVVSYSHQLLDAEIATQGAHAEMLSAKKEYLPTLNFDREFSLDFRMPTEGRRWTWLTRLDLSQPIYLGGRVRAEAKQQELRYAVAEYNEEAQHLYANYIADVAYWTLSRAKSYLNAINDYKTIVVELRNVVAERYAEGYISKSDLLQVESRLSDAEYQLSQAMQREEVALHNFNILRGMETTREVVLSESIFDAMPMLERENIVAILARHPDYAIAESEASISHWGIRASQAKFLPSIEVGLYGMLQPSMPHVKSGDLRLDGGLYFSFRSPIFHFGQRKHALSAARSNYMRQQLKVEDVADRITQDESDAWTNLQSTFSRVMTTQRSLALARENLDINTYSYHEGLATILDVLQAQISWLQIYQNVIASQYDYAVALAAYRYIISSME